MFTCSCWLFVLRCWERLSLGAREAKVTGRFAPSCKFEAMRPYDGARSRNSMGTGDSQKTAADIAVSITWGCFLWLPTCSSLPQYIGVSISAPDCCKPPPHMAAKLKPMEIPGFMKFSLGSVAFGQRSMTSSFPGALN